MINNYNELINQFVAARGIKNVDMSCESFINDFLEWVEERKKIGRDYLTSISNLGIFHDSWYCAEVNKGICDSVTLPFHTKLLTPYIDSTMVDDPQRIIHGNFHIDKKYAIPFVSTKDILMKVISNVEVMTYMTENPYNNRLDGWDKLHNSNNNNIIVGVYGSTLDKDRQEKLEMLLHFKSKLNHIREIDYTLGDEYFYVLSSSDNRPKRRFR